MSCPRCQGFVMRERYGFSWLSWSRCVNCGWYGEWSGRDPSRLPAELERLVDEVTAQKAARKQKRTVNYVFK